VGNEDVAVVTFETDLGAAGSQTVSQISHGRKNRLWFSFDGGEGSYEFNQESPDSFWVGGLKQNSTCDKRTGIGLHSQPQGWVSIPTAPASALPSGADAESAPKPPEAAVGATKAL
jgi:predicted dehydrogenase